ncbi:hypothetical protein VNPA141752_61600 [Pseudomonas aeruginosa]|nr:hypothetical protein VNPA120840_67000 [Pseudomonas aeruginosa]GLF06539.1 hypothetical protein VNPA120889_67030 [Pseudomonas aeruginosa]GLF49491.1 hypothetical protein VNPA141752_61600 [Pseudomonas aeruginosa]
MAGPPDDVAVDAQRLQFHDMVRRVAEDDARLEANIERALAKALR